MVHFEWFLGGYNALYPPSKGYNINVGDTNNVSMRENHINFLHALRPHKKIVFNLKRIEYK